ncbi:hypothetical protein ACFQ21_27985 [Ohtaekwangia kribbensis]|jgi:hypothetical protein|uniref:Uncharacterized protein n=1 Tax=Ohtaekwangia kribbensis TaxID=688913 RepID=A0ABW3KCY1_9BACT
MKTYFAPIFRFALMLIPAILMLTSCEQENVEPELEAAPGGGTLTVYKAYTLDSIPGQGNIYGRVVFWRDNTKKTLVQVSLYNTASADIYPTGIYTGKAEDDLVTELQPLYSVSGATGEFSTSKFYVITDKTFFENLETYNAHVKILLQSTVIASGDIGENATPVAASE